MTLRSCIFKRCGNYIDLRDRSYNDVKLFSFPKNPERRKKWIELGQVPQNLRESMYYFCSDHFDKKFLAINNRRTVLVGEALPFPYVETAIEESNRDDEADVDYLMYDLDRSNNTDKQGYENDQDIVVESTTIVSDTQDNLVDQQFVNTLSKEEDEEYIFYSEDELKKESNSCNINKRKSENGYTLATSSISKILKASQGQNSLQNSGGGNNDDIKKVSNVFPSEKDEIPNKESCQDSMKSYELVDAKHVTTFIFKGEEYVQMPKNYYLKEKKELMKKIQKMERALQAIKEQISTIDI